MPGAGLFGVAGEFLRQPFRQEMGLAQWGLLVVFVVTVAIFWQHVLRHITEE